jgi:hypothetical protein
MKKNERQEKIDEDGEAAKVNFRSCGANLYPNPKPNLPTASDRSTTGEDEACSQRRGRFRAPGDEKANGQRPATGHSQNDRPACSIHVLCLRQE